jgi:hypothetical protein
MTEQLKLDADGVPILTDVVSQDEEAEAEPNPLPETRLAAMSANDIARTILDSSAFRHQLDEMAMELAQNVHLQLEQLIRPAIEQAVTEILDDCENTTYDSIRQQLEVALPEVLVSSLEKETLGNS